MQLQPLDAAIVFVYIAAIFIIAIRAGFIMRKNLIKKRREGMRPIENHYIAGRSITFWEAVLSIIATEFSAAAFLTIPTYVYFENLSYLRFAIGACLSRALIATLLLPHLYGKGLTVLEIFSHRLPGQKHMASAARRGRAVFALFYIVTKLLGVGVRLVAGAILVAQFFGISTFVAIVLICVMTYLYIMLGGLKAVVRTDMTQALVFVVGGVAAHYAVVEMSDLQWIELAKLGYSSGKFSLTSGGDWFSFASGVLAGIVYDAATHGVDQEFCQKVLGATDLKTAQKAIAWSAVGSLVVNLLFLSLGVILWAHYTQTGQAIPPTNKIFSSLIWNNFPTPLKGLMVASVLAACMSTLDSSINALSASFWNDLMSPEKSRMFRVYIHLDNFIITIAVIIVAYALSASGDIMQYGPYFSYLCTAPLLAFFICTIPLERFINVRFSPATIVMSVFSCFLGMTLNHLRFNLHPQLTILCGLLFAMAFLWGFSEVNKLFSAGEDQT